MTDDDIQGLTYEQGLDQLELLIRRLEAGQVQLHEAISCYERGVRLAQHCGQLLDRTEATVTQLMVGREVPLPADMLERPGAEAASPATPVGTIHPLRRARVAEQGLFPTGDAGTPRQAAPPVADDDDIPF